MGKIFRILRIRDKIFNYMPKKVQMLPSSKSKIISKTIYQELFPKQLSKSDKRKIEIIEGAIRAYASVDFDSISFDAVATPAKTSRKLVQHYFPDKNELFETSMKLIRAQFQVLAVEAISKAQTPKAQIEEYIRSTFYWAKSQPLHTKAWMLFFQICAQKPKFKNMHAELTKMGEQRIMAMISNLKKSEKIAANELLNVAKNIQRLITGGLIEVCTERNIEDVELVQEQVVKACMMLVESLNSGTR